jgi:ribonuclease D
MWVQVCAAEGPVLLVDAKAIGDLSPLAKAISSHALLGHALDQDLAALSSRIRVQPGPVRDSQVLAGFGGLGFPRRLDELLFEVLGVQTPATCTMSDWSKRPPSAAQQAYAAADVSHLHALVDKIAAGLTAERIEWANGAAADASEQALAPTDLEGAWTRMLATPHLRSPRAREAVRLLAAWREEQARETNQAPRQVVSDAILIDLARRRPESVEEMLENRLAPKRAPRDHGATLLTLLARAGDTPADLLPPSLALGLHQKAVASLLQTWALDLEAREGIAIRLSLPEKERDRAVRCWSGGAEPVLKPAWREQAFGQAVRDVLASRASNRADCARESTAP